MLVINGFYLLIKPRHTDEVCHESSICEDGAVRVQESCSYVLVLRLVLRIDAFGNFLIVFFANFIFCILIGY